MTSKEAKQELNIFKKSEMNPFKKHELVNPVDYDNKLDFKEEFIEQEVGEK